MSALRINTDRLVELGVQAEVAHPSHSGSYSVDDYGRPIMLPGMSGVVVNARVGDLVFAWAADHLEPGVSAGCAERGRHQALQFLACVGNVVRVLSGPAAGAEGTRHRQARVRPRRLPARRRSSCWRRATACSCGRRAGAAAARLPGRRRAQLQPGARRGMGVAVSADGRLRVEVAAEIPAFLMGAGLGMSSEWANCDVMFTRRETVERHGFEDVRLGDVVVMHDQDHRYGRGYRKGMLAIGVVAHGGYGGVPGHGTGVVDDLVRPERALRDRARAGRPTCARASTWS